MKKFLLITVCVALALLCVGLLFACGKEDEKVSHSIIIVSDTGNVLSVIEADGTVSTLPVETETDKGFVYSWVAYKGEKPIVIIENGSLNMIKGAYTAASFDTTRLIVYPYKYYTLVNIDQTDVTEKMVIGDVAKALPVVQKAYADFKGYSADREGVEMLTDVRGSFDSPWNVQRSRVTIYPVFDYKRIGLTLDYGSEYVTNKGNVPDYMIYGDEFYFTFPTPQREGYTFGGWFTRQSAGEKLVDASGRLLSSVKFKSDAHGDYSFDIQESEGDYPYVVTFYARWALNSYNVDYYDGDEKLGSRSIQYGEKVPSIDITSVKNGKSFLYWYENDETTAYDMESGMEARDISLHAKRIDENTTCANCGADISQSSAPLCKALSCSECNALLREATAEHQYGKTEQDKAPDCFTTGLEHKTCNNCKDKQYVVVPMLTHEFSFKESVAPTCGSRGYTSFECKNCKSLDIRYSDEVVDHKFNTSRVEADEYNLGYTTNICQVCNVLVKTMYDLDSNVYTVIETADDFIAAASTNAFYWLNNDIDLGENNWKPWGYDNGTVSTFSAGLYGNGKTIKYKAKVYDTRSEDLYLGLFASLAGKVFDLNIEADVDCYSSGVKNVYVGGVSAKATESAYIANVSVELRVKTAGIGSNVYLGGIVGQNEGDVEACFVNVSTEGNVRDNLYLGGIVGENLDKGWVKASSAYCNVAQSSQLGSASVGGIVGVNKGVVVDVYAGGVIDAQAALAVKAGGAVGENVGIATKAIVDINVTASGIDKRQSSVGFAIGENKGQAVRLFGNLDARVKGYNGEQIATAEVDGLILTQQLFADSVKEKAYGVDADLLKQTEVGEIKVYEPIFRNAYLHLLLEPQTDKKVGDGLSLNDYLASIDSSIKTFELTRDYDLKYKEVVVIDRLFGTLNGNGHILKGIIIPQGNSALIGSNYGEVVDLSIKNYMYADKNDAKNADSVGLVGKNNGVISNASGDNSYKIAVKLSIQLIIFVVLCVLWVLAFIIETSFSAMRRRQSRDYVMYKPRLGLERVSGIFSLLIVLAALVLFLAFGSTYISLRLACLTLAVIIPLIMYLVQVKKDKAKIYVAVNRIKVIVAVNIATYLLALILAVVALILIL